MRVESEPEFSQVVGVMPARQCRLTVIVPTRNERDNVFAVVERVSASTIHLDAEILFVDDSDDDTPQAVSSVMRSAPMPVRLIHRPMGSRQGGLGGAVKAALMATGAEWVVVMDGDLQHPPELIPELLAAGTSRGCDLVVASRYCGLEGSADGLSSPARRFVSSSATIAARALFPGAAGRVSDPMSGFFALRRAAVDAERLRPEGFKILLEVLVRTIPLSVAEVPFAFGERSAGLSKASSLEGVRFVRQMIRLRLANAMQAIWRPDPRPTTALDSRRPKHLIGRRRQPDADPGILGSERGTWLASVGRRREEAACG